VTPLFFLTGPTASGKSDLAHQLAERRGLRLLSADSMMVYRRMNIGTAKPSEAEIRDYDYAGLNLCEPGEAFSTGDWIRAIQNQLDGRPTLVAGGTGLYYRALIQGLQEEEGLPEVDDSRPLAELQAELESLQADALHQLDDAQNPRRVARAIAWLQAGRGLPSHFQARDPFPVPVLRRPTEELNERIALRAAHMFEQGLLEECEGLRDALQGTASQAIGYAEALACLDGELSREAAVERVSIRTRQYGKRQRTWFRNQMQAQWVDHIDADAVERIWDASGPFPYTG